MNKLILGDCLEVLRKIDSESVDLVYLDPPFFSNKNYEVIWGDEGEKRSFQDRWAGGIDHYIDWLKMRVVEMYRVLKPTGSIFLHCDWHANAYIKVFILDKVFGQNNFRNELVWYYRRWTNVSKQFQNMHDTIFWYSKSATYTFNKNGYEPSESQKKKFEKGWDQNVVKSSKGKIIQYIVYNREKFEASCKVREGAKIVYRETEELKVAPSDILEIAVLNSQSSERIGYPTQKPEELLYKLIYTASNENDVILDPFLGGGTTIAVADKLSRKWIGIDQSPQAVKVTEFRLNVLQGKILGNTKNMFAQPFSVQLHKYDYDTLRYKDAFEFETWIVQQYGGTPNAKQKSDLGIDGRTDSGTPIQVKRSDNVGRNVIDNFFSAIQRCDKTVYERNKAENKPVGIIITFSFNKGVVNEVARLKNTENIVIELLTVESIVPIAKKPTLEIKLIDQTNLATDIPEKSEGTIWDGLKEIYFEAHAKSEVEIQFYAWDFDYKGVFSPEILFDKMGKQSKKFGAGEYQIAVKVIDNEGLESLEVVKLKINGKVERQ
jgi:DNA modification methylase